MAMYSKVINTFRVICRRLFYCVAFIKTNTSKVAEVEQSWFFWQDMGGPEKDLGSL
jgi:hypothetical protein